MKYFKLTDLTTREELYISSTLPNETTAHVAVTLHLDLDKKYKIEEVPKEEFDRETEDEEDDLGGLSFRRDFDCEDDYDLEDDDADCFCV